MSFQDETKRWYSIEVTSQEIDVMERYRALDDFGKEMVDRILNILYRECQAGATGKTPTRNGLKVQVRKTTRQGKQGT